LDVDVLLLQEHDLACSVPGYSFGVHAFTDGRWEGCSVLFRDAPTSTFRTFTVDLRHGKTAAVAEMDGVVFVSVHLKGGPGTEEDRRAQMALLLKALPAEGPCLIAGDMNDTDPDATFGALLAAARFKRAPYDGFSGFNSALTTPLVLDHMYARQVTVVDVHLPYALENPWLSDATSGSDHAAVVAEVWPRSFPDAT
jgi:endonuclease/exonuclease/phosphatase family metal-dependent hydrolase